MTGENDVRTRAVAASSVMLIRRFQRSSSETASKARAMEPSSGEPDVEAAHLVDGESGVGADDGGGLALLDDGRPGRDEARRQGGAVVDGVGHHAPAVEAPRVAVA